MLRIKELRTRKRWTQQELADTAGVSRVTVNRLERGRPKSIDFDVLEKLAEALGVKPASLLVQVPTTAKRARTAPDTASAGDR